MSFAGPRQFGRFQLVELLGQGGFGTVYRARDEQLDRDVALKIPRDSVFVDERDRQRFLKEARTAARLSHPGIVKVYEVGENDGVPFIALELIDGQPLSDVLASQRLATGQAISLAKKICEALHHAHQTGVVHRDLKPANIMIDAAGQPHILDFGLGKREVDETMTAEGVVKGTYAYMSPEQARGETQRIGPASDLFSLGVTLFEILTGERPFRGDRHAILQSLLHDEPPRPRSLRTELSADLETVLLKCLEKDIARRYGSARELAEELTRIQQGRPIVARPVSRWEHAWRFCRRHRWPVASLAMVFAVLTISLAVVSAALFETHRAQQQTLAHLEHARDVVDTWYTGVGSVLPFYPEVRAELLLQAAEDYERFTVQEYEVAGLELERGKTYLRLAAVRRELSQMDQAKQACRDAEGVFLALLKENRSDHAARLGLAQSRAELAALNSGDDSQFVDAIDMLRKVVSATPADEQAREALAIALLNRGFALYHTGQHEQAEKALREAVERFTSMAGATDAPPRHVAAESSARSLLAALLRDTNRFEEATRQLETATAKLRPLTAGDDALPQLIKTRGGTLVFLASVQRELGNADDEMQSLRAAIEDYERLSERVGVWSVSEELAVARTDLGQLLLETGMCRNAVTEFADAAATFQVLAESTNLPRYHEQWAMSLDNQAQALAAIGEVDDAQAAAERAVDLLARLVKLRSDVTGYLHRLAVAESHLAYVIHQKNDNGLALDWSQAAEAHAENLLAVVPRDDAATNVLAMIFRYRANMLEGIDPAAADACHDQCVNRWKALCDRSTSPVYHDTFARYLALWSLDRHRDAERAVSLAEAAVADVGNNADFRSTLALALVRSGRWQDSIAALQAAKSLRGYLTGQDFLVEAVALHELGNAGRAVQSFRLASDWIADHQPGDADVIRLRADVAAMLEISD